MYPVTATANHAAFASEASLQVKYQLANGLALKAGYEVLWLDGVALAPGQIRETYTASTIPPNVRALGVNFGSNSDLSAGFVSLSKWSIALPIRFWPTWANEMVAGFPH